MAKKESSGFHTPFKRLQNLKELRAPARSEGPGGRPAAPLPPARAAAPVARAQTARAGADADARADADAKSFEQAMRGARPLPAAERRRRASPLDAAERPRAPRPPTAPPVARRNDDADADADLADLVIGQGRFTIEEGPSTLSGRAPGTDRRLLRRLRGGDYPIEAELDLHGRGRDQAEAEVEAFIARARAAGRRCVLVIHGRGLNSGEAGPVLKEAVKRSLSQGRAARAVLAFTFAGPEHGADGATLVLLRKKA